MLDNLQTKFVLIELFFIMLMVLCILWVFKGCCKVFKAMYNKLYALIFWNCIFRFILESYIEICVDCFVNLRPLYLQCNQFYDYVSLVFSICFNLILIVFPFYCLRIMKKTSESRLLHDKELMEKQGSLYQGLKI